DDSCVTDTINIDINPPAYLAINDVIINDLIDECSGSCEGEINLEISGGTPPYSIVWTQYIDNDAIILNESSSFITSLCSGNYSASVFDIYGCNTFSGNISITENELLNLEIVSISEYNCEYNISCFAAQDGEITVNATGGGNTYTYSLFNETITLDSETGLFENLTEGTYSISVLDELDCGDTITDILLTGPPAPLVVEEFNIESIATYCLDNGSISAEISGGCGIPYTIAVYNSDESGNPLTLNTQYTQDSTNISVNNLGEGWYTLIVSDGEPIFDNNTGYIYNCEQQSTFYMAETSAPNFDVFASADSEGIIIPGWSPGDTLIAPEINLGIGNCAATLTMLNPDGIIGDFGGSGYGFEINWYADTYTVIEEDADPDDPNYNPTLTEEDLPLDAYNNQVNENGEYNPIYEIEVDIQILETAGFFLVYTDLCPNGVINYTTYIEVPVMALTIDAESSLSTYSSGEYQSSISCAGEEDAFASVQISGGSESTFSNSSCLENQEFWTVNWFIDDGDTELTSLDTQIIDGNFNEEDNLPLLSNGDNIPDTYSLGDLAPGFYFAQIEDCLVEGCALIVEFDLRAEPEPIFMDTVITQADCELNEEASACVQANGGVPPYTFNFSMLDPNNPTNNIPIPLNNEGCVSGQDLQPGLYSTYTTDSNDCESEIIEFEINLNNYIDSVLVEVNLANYPGGYNVSCSGESDGNIESIVVYSLEDLDGDGIVNTALNADVDGDGIINTLDPNIDGDFYFNMFDTDMDGDGVLNGNDPTPLGIDTDDIIDTWTPNNLSAEFDIEWGPWDPENLPAGEYSAIIYSLAPNGIDECGTEFTFSITQPSELYVFVPDYETCENCPVNVTAEISGGQGPYRDIWINLETGDTLNNIVDPNIGLNEISDINIDYDLDTINGFPHNILLLPGSYSLSIIDGNGCEPIELTQFDIYTPSEEVSWATVDVSGCEPNTSSCGGIANIIIDYEFLNNQLCQIQWLNCNGDILDGFSESENMITELCAGSYYAQILYPSDFDVDGDGILNNNDDDMDNDGIPNAGEDGILQDIPSTPIDETLDNDPDVDGDGILNENDPFPEGDFLVQTLCFEYNDEGFEIFVEAIQHDLCDDNQTDGNSIAIFIEGGTGSFSFEWSNSDGEIIANTQNIENIVADTYTVTVTDGSGCEMIKEIEISEPNPIDINYNLSEYNGYNVPCPENAETNQCGGEISLIITGAIPFNPNNNFNPNSSDFTLPTLDGDEYYEYTINNENNNISTIPQPLIIENIINESIYATINNVCAGNNIIDIIGQFDCVATIEIFMTGPEVFELDISPTPVTCPNDEDGAIELDFSGGVSPYTYEWFLGDELYSNSGNISNLNGGIYSLTITDLNNCTYDTIVEIYEPDIFEIETRLFEPQCSELLGWVEFDITGGHVGNYEYIFANQVYNYIPTDTIFLTTGEHPFVFIDAQGCLSDTVLVNLSPISEDCLQIPTLFTPNGDTQNDIWQIGGIENFTEAKIRVYNRWGQLIFKSNGNYFGNEWDGTYNGDPLPFAVYYYTIDPVNENGTTYNGGVTIKR
ncbi:MAG: hypothetical protein CMP56_00560, partial [Flavobacteriales bacterium]|nr:hypothetical protein [Flavobacteriales bacterium]